MDFLEFTAGNDDNDRRLDKILRKIAGQKNLSGIYKAIRKGLVRLNGKKTDFSEKVFAGDKIKIASFLLENENSIKQTKKSPENSNADKKEYKPDFQIIFENKDILVVNKPYDVTVQGSDDSLNKKVLEYYKASRSSSSSLAFSPGPLHRLDRKTTGLLVFSMSLDGARWFSKNIAEHTITKIYLAVVQGNLLKTERWNDFIKKDSSEKSKGFKTVEISKEKSDDFADAKEAATEAKPLKHFKISGIECTLVQFHIFTGRTHQIRAQSAFHGFPLFGDTAYGGIKTNAEQDFFLHASELVFPKERLSGIPEKLEAQMPQSMLNILQN